MQLLPLGIKVCLSVCLSLFFLWRVETFSIFFFRFFLFFLFVVVRLNCVFGNNIQSCMVMLMFCLIVCDVCIAYDMFQEVV